MTIRRIETNPSRTPEIISDHFLPGLTPAVTSIDYAHTTPVHVIKANLDWTNERWDIDTYLRYASTFDGIQRDNPIGVQFTLAPIPNHVAVDGHVAYRLTDNLTLALAGQNLLDSPQRQTSGAEVERRIYFTATASF